MQTKIKGLPKARAYVRVSTLKESQKDSPEHQDGLIRETAAGEGINIEHTYLDRGTATNIIERDDVQKMVEDAKRGEYNTIYFASLSRFSRDTLDAISLKRMLVNALGIRLVSIEDMYDSAKEDNEMVFTIISSVNQKQSENISTATKRGKRQSARAGKFTGSVAPYGYRKEVIDGKKTLVVEPEKATVVEEIFDLYVNKGFGEKAIVKYLNEDRDPVVPSPKGGLWGLTTIQRILQNENYTGYLAFGKMESQKLYDINDLQNRRKKLVQRDRSLWERTEKQTHEPIITKELYEKVYQVRELRGGGKRGGGIAFINVFAEYIFCKECGSAMVTMSTTRSLSKTKTEKRYRYLMCSKRRRQGAKGCTNAKWVPYYETRDEIIKGLIERLNKAISMEKVGEEAAAGADYRQQDFDKEIKRLEKIIADNRRLLFEIRKQNMLGEVSATQYEFERTQYEQEIADAEKRLVTVTRKSNDHKDRDKLRKEIVQALTQLTSMKDYDEVEATRINLMPLVERIEVKRDGEVDVYTVLGRL